MRKQLAITEDNSVTISPFAQTDVMQTFLFGINDGFISALADEIPTQIHNIFHTIADDNFAEGKKQAVYEKLASATPNIINQIIGKAQKQYLWPITQSVATLPIDELAMLAESMINITSLRRKVAIDSNIGTVGGPVDVAMITKSDGFIWMKRKHYFEQSYNPQYFYSHYWLQGGVNDEHQNDSVELKCYLDYLIAKYVAPQKENGNGSSIQYNVTESVISAQPVAVLSKE